MRYEEFVRPGDGDDDLGEVLLMSEDDEAGGLIVPAVTTLESGEPIHLFEAVPSTPSRSPLPISSDLPSPICVTETDRIEAAVSAALVSLTKVFQRQMDAAALQQTARDVEQSKANTEHLLQMKKLLLRSNATQCVRRPA